MRTKKDARRLPEGYVDDVSTVRWNHPKFFVSTNEDLEEEERGTINIDSVRPENPPAKGASNESVEGADGGKLVFGTVPKKPDKPPAKRLKMDEISKSNVVINSEEKSQNPEGGDLDNERNSDDDFVRKPRRKENKMVVKDDQINEDASGKAHVGRLVNLILA